MDKRLWINIGLLSLIILLYFFLINSDKETAPQLSRLSNIDQSDIVQIKVLRSNLDDFEFNKQDGFWQLNSPQKFRVNISRINAMLRILETQSHGQLNPKEVDLEQLGLSDPVIKMKLNDHEFIFGNTDAIDQRRYVLFDGKIHLTNDSLYQQLMTNAAFFAALKLLPDAFKIESITFPDNNLTQVDNTWQLENALDISPDQLQRIVFNWQNVSAISAEQYQPIETEESIIKISSTNNQTIQFVLISDNPHLVLARKDLGIQFHLGSDETNKLLLIENINPDEITEPIGLELN